MKTRNVEIPYIISFVSQMIDDEPLTAEILDIFHQKQANFLESWEDMLSPIIRLVKRKDGHEHVEQVLHYYDTAKSLFVKRVAISASSDTTRRNSSYTSGENP